MSYDLDITLEEYEQYLKDKTEYYYYQQLYEGSNNMGLTAKRSERESSDIELIEPGLYHGVCYAIYDLGTHKNEKFGGDQHSVLLTWELPECRIDIETDGEKKNLPRVISKWYTLSLSKKSHLCKDLETWRGKEFTDDELQGFDLKKLLSVNCYMQIIHQKKGENTRAIITNIIKLPKDRTVLKPENKTIFFSFEENPSNIPEETPEWIEDIIKKSAEWDMLQSLGNDEVPAEDNNTEESEDDMPF